MSSTISSEHQPSNLTVPAEYLEDVRSALIREIKTDSTALKRDQSLVLERGLEADLREGRREDRAGAAGFLRNDLRLLDQLLDATADTAVTGDRDTVVFVLEEMIRVLTERLSERMGYTPLNVDAVLAITERMRWAAEQALRIEPGLSGQPKVTITRAQRDGLRELIDIEFDDAESITRDRDRALATARRISAAVRLLDRIGWEEEGENDSYVIVVDPDLAELVQALARFGSAAELRVIEVAELVAAAMRQDDGEDS